MDYELVDLIDFDELKKLTDKWTHLIGLPMGIFDPHGNALLGSGWLSICTAFHRVHPITSERCRQSDQENFDRLEDGEEFCYVRCPNGLVDAGAAIVVDGKYLGGLGFGQFFLEPPDMDFFAKQADAFDFDKERYLAAVKEVPILSLEYVEQVSRIWLRIARMIADTSLAKLNLMELNCELEKQAEEMRIKENKFQMMEHSIENAPDRIAWVDPEGHFLYANKAACAAMGCTKQDILLKRISDLNPQLPPEKWAQHFQDVKQSKSIRQETQHVDEKGGVHDVEVSTNYLHFAGQEFLCSFGKDITKRKRTQKKLAEQLEFEQVITSIATRLAQAKPEHLKVTIDTTLETLGLFLCTERAFLAQFSEDGNHLYFSNLWAAEDITPDSGMFEMDIASIPWVAQQIHNNRIIYAGPELEGLPPEAEELRERLIQDGINSGVVVPIQVEGHSIGMLGLDTLNQPRDYEQPIIDRLRLVADMIGTTLHRIRAQEILDQQLLFEDLISRLSATFIHIKAAEIDKRIEIGLQLIVEFMDMERAHLFQFDSEQNKLIQTHAFTTTVTNVAPKTLQKNKYPWFFEKLLNREPISFSTLDNLPKDAGAEREYLQQQGIQSVMVLPLVAAGVTHGCLSLASLTKECKWPGKLLQQFSLLAEVLSNALLRKLADEKIGRSLSEVQLMKERLEQENVYLREEMQVNTSHEGIVGESAAINSVKAAINQVAPSDATVLITGETGTGKELVTHAIHNSSQRNKDSLIKLNCAALPPSLIEAELFGREKGAYTGALTRQAGRFELADGGTLFLDEIGDMPLELQGKLLRVLQEGEFERLGGVQVLKTDVRVIAATNKDLTQAVAEGRFREDLYYRLNVFPIEVPPLRTRAEDIPLLVWHFVQELSKGMGKTITHLSKSTMNELQHYPWPGNVRELKNVIERALIVCNSETLHIKLTTDNAPAPADSLTLDEVNRNHILSVLEKTGWRVRGRNGAAQFLAVNPQTLDSRMKKLGIKRP